MILQYVNKGLREKLIGNASIRGIDISLWQHFPTISIRLKDVVFSDSVYHKPMLTVQTLSSRFSLFDLLRSKKTINDIIIENGVLHLFKDSTGYSNHYVLRARYKQPEKQKKSNVMAVEIKDVTIKSLDVLIEDKVANKEFSMLVNNMGASVKRKDSVIEIRMEEKILMKGGLGFNLEKGAYLEKQTVEGDWKININEKTGTLSFDKTEVQINKVPFELSGFFAMAENPHFKLTIHADAVPLSNVQAAVTNHIRKKIGQLQLQKPVRADAMIEGSLLPHTKPNVTINWETNKNILTTTQASFSDCKMSGNFMNHINKDSVNDDKNSKVTVSAFSGNWDGIFLTGKDIVLTNLKDPVLKLSLHSNCSFEALDNKFALKNVRFIEGQAEFDLFYDGPVSNNRSMLQDIEGKLTVSNGSIEYVPHNFTFKNCNGEIAFYKDSLSMRKFSFSYLENKFNVEVDGKNVQRKFLAADISNKTIIKCNVTTPFLNLDDFKTLFDAKRQRLKQSRSQKNFLATSKRIDEMLDNSVIQVIIKANDIRHRHLEGKNFDADIRFEPYQWEIARASLNMAGGSIQINGKVTPAGNYNHIAAVSAKINSVDVKKLFYAFDDFGQDAISRQHLNGNFSGNAAIKAGISSKGKIIPASLFGTVNFSLKNGSIKNFPPLVNIKNYVFRNRDLNDVQFAELKDRIDIKGTNVYLNRMEIASNVLWLFAEGNYGLNGKNTDMLLQVMLSNLNGKNFDDEIIPVNKGVKAKTGSSIWLRAVNGDDGKVKLKVVLTKKRNQKIKFL